MNHWLFRHIAQVAVGVLITALLGGIGFIAWNSVKIPQLEEKLSVHDIKLAKISVLLLKIMNKSNGDVDSELLYDLFSQLEFFSKYHAKLFSRASIGLARDRDLNSGDWFSPLTIINYSEIRKIEGERELSALIENILLQRSVNGIWAINGLNIQYGSPDITVVFETKPGVTFDNLSTAVAVLNKLIAEQGNHSKNDAPNNK